jgi:hypothetical protein
MSNTLIHHIDKNTYGNHAPVVDHLIELANLSAQARKDIVARPQRL